MVGVFGVSSTWAAGASSYGSGPAAWSVRPPHWPRNRRVSGRRCPHRFYNGEDTFVRSPGGYAANVEAVRTTPPEPLPYDDAPAAHVEDTPNTPTIETLVDLANARFPRPDRPWQASDTLKNVVLMITEVDGVRHPLVIGVPGDREVDMRRLAAQLVPGGARAFQR